VINIRDKGLAVLSSYAHPRIVNTVKRAKKRVVSQRYTLS